ncbi:MAG: hypothetical protein IJN39_00015 [Clostridia bacterium]|nr:hypothetical protein [Clostridia bacterium]
MKKLYEGSISKNFFLFALPLIITTLFSQAYNIINTIIAGALLGDSSISAIGSTAPFISFISSLFWGYGTGVAIHVAVLFGQSNYQKMLNVIKVNIVISSLCAVIISVLCLVFHNTIFDFLNIETALREETFIYFSIYISGLFIFNITWCCLYFIHSLGLTVLPLIASVMTNVINIAGSYVLIKFCGFGVAGIAVSTVFSALCTAIFYGFMLTKTFRQLGVKLSGIYFDKKELKTSWNFAFPSILQQSVMYFCTAFVSPLTNGFGADAIAGYTVGMRLYDLNSGVYQNSNKVVSSFVAQCIGAKKYSLIKKGMKTIILQTFLFILPFLSVTVFCAGGISRLFLDSLEGIHYAEIFLKFCMPFILFNSINNLMHAVFKSAGAGMHLVVSTLIYSVSRILYSYLLYQRFEMYGIYAAIVLSWITEAIYGLVIYFSGKWKSEELRLADSN